MSASSGPRGDAAPAGRSSTARSLAGRSVAAVSLADVSPPSTLPVPATAAAPAPPDSVPPDPAAPHARPASADPAPTRRVATVARLLLVAAVLLFWVRPLWSLYQESGLFGAIGVDFAMYAAQSLVLRHDGPASLYSLDAIEGQLQRFAPSSGVAGAYLRAAPVAYPPVFAWLMTPFALLPPPAGFLVWTVLGLAAAGFLGARAAASFPAPDRWWVAALVATSFPALYALYLGQVTVLLALALAECYVALRAGRDGRAGLWLACLAIKPHYAIPIGLLLLWKRRWRAVAGALAGGALLLLGSLLAAGPSALAAWPGALADVSTFHGAETVTFPEHMVNWRGLILRVAPGISAESGLGLAGVLGGLTILAVGLLWRGPWAPRDPTFAGSFTALLVAALLVNHHSHPHGLVLLAVPLAHLVAQIRAGRAASRLTRQAIFLGLAAPTLVFTISVNATATGAIVQLVMVAGLAGLLSDRLRARGEGRGARGEGRGVSECRV